MTDASMYDFIIIGGGSAGCVLANRLSADPGNRVLLLEAGARERRMEVAIPAAWTRLFKTACDWNYETEPNPGMNGPCLYVPRGRMLGGTSSMNAMVYVRGNRADFDEWDALGCPGWSYADVLPYFRHSEDNERGASEYHGAGGLLSVSDSRALNPLSRAFIESAIAAGIAHNPDCNGARQDGVSLLQSTTRRGRRCSTADAFLQPALRRSNLKVLTNVRVTQIVFEGQRAVAVKYIRDAAEQVARAGAEVIVSCGALDSPKLLLLSGVGPADELRRHGIDVVLDLPGVGRNLQEHPVGALTARCAKPWSMLAAESPANIARYLLFKRGMLASNGPDAAAFVRTRAGLAAPDVEIVVLPVLWDNEGLTRPTEHGLTIASILLTPRSRGHVTLRSADPLAAPRITTNHLSDESGEDMRAIIEGIRIARRIAAAAPLAGLLTGEIDPGDYAMTDAEIAASVRAKAQTVWHPVGTCRMGSDAASVVDASLRVHGLEALRVIDASIMPTIIRGHTNAPTIMIAEKGADMILAPARPSLVAAGAL